MKETQEGIHQDILFQDVPTRRVPLIQSRWVNMTTSGLYVYQYEAAVILPSNTRNLLLSSSYSLHTTWYSLWNCALEEECYSEYQRRDLHCGKDTSSKRARGNPDGGPSDPRDIHHWKESFSTALLRTLEQYSVACPWPYRILLFQFCQHPHLYNEQLRATDSIHQQKIPDLSGCTAPVCTTAGTPRSTPCVLQHAFRRFSP